MQVIVALAIFCFVIVIWRIVYVKRGNISFWQLAANQPDAAYEWIQGRSDWLVLRADDPKVKALEELPHLVGPFKLSVPSAGGIVAIFAEQESIDESQREFTDSFASVGNEAAFPWLSWAAMLYPVVAMIVVYVRGAQFFATLGYGFANLGYLLFGSGIVFGSFRALGFEYRIPTLIAAVAVWIVGTVLSNL